MTKETYPISMGKVYDYWETHEAEQIDINECEPKVGEHIAWVGHKLPQEITLLNTALSYDRENYAVNIRPYYMLSVGTYGEFVCMKENISKWMPVNKFMQSNFL